jgi:hypothetical protein
LQKPVFGYRNWVWPLKNYCILDRPLLSGGCGNRLYGFELGLSFGAGAGPIILQHTSRSRHHPPVVRQCGHEISLIVS